MPSTSYIPFFDHGVCPWRVPGKPVLLNDWLNAHRSSPTIIPADIALALSFPVLWYRIKTVGLSGAYHPLRCGLAHLPSIYRRVYGDPDSPLRHILPPLCVVRSHLMAIYVNTV